MVRVRGVALFLTLAAIPCVPLAGQQAARPKDVREAAKAGSSAIPRLTQYLKDPSLDVRAEAVKQITEIGPPRSLDPLVLATRDPDAQIQILATDGLVNYYLPGYFKSGLSGSLRHVGTDIKGRFTDTNDQVIDRYITVRPEVVTAIVGVLDNGATRDAKANAARALGVLRAGAAVDGLVAAAHSKDGALIYETVVALEKIRDESAGPRLEFLMHDLDSKVQVAAIEAVGLLRDTGARSGLIDVLNQSGNARVKRTALTSLAMLPAESNRAVYQQYIRDKDDKLRAAAAEGFARLRNPADTPMLDQAWKDEMKPQVRLALAFLLADRPPQLFLAPGAVGNERLKTLRLHAQPLRHGDDRFALTWHQQPFHVSRRRHSSLTSTELCNQGTQKLMQPRHAFFPKLGVPGKGLHAPRLCLRKEKGKTNLT